MKPLVITAIIVALFALIFPMAVIGFDTVRTHNAPAEPDSPAPRLAIDENNADASISVRVLNDGEISDMTLRDYLIGVVSAEMPASFEPEALRAQVVAARTYTLYHMLIEPPAAHPDADTCTDFACCKAYYSTETLRENWGDAFDANYEKIVSAVTDTDGKIMVYDNEPILAVFHSSSNGKTETSGNVWGADMPYLVSVDSPESEGEVPNYIQNVSVSFDDFKNTICAAFSNAQFSDDAHEWISGISHTASGRVASLTVGGVRIDGTKFRDMFSLRSASFTILIGDGSFIITTTGYGHGVGLSQYGANILAGQGFSYPDILTHYYSGAKLADAFNVLS